jgi:plastocyanin
VIQNIIPLFLLSLLVSACAPQTDSNINHNEHNTAVATSTLAHCPATIVIKNLSFNPASCKVKTGTTLTFKNEDGFPHTATALSSEVIAFDTGELAGGASKDITFSTGGTLNYRCEIHPSMTGMIVVEP